MRNRTVWKKRMAVMLSAVMVTTLLPVAAAPVKVQAAVEDAASARTVNVPYMDNEKGRIVIPGIGAPDEPNESSSTWQGSSVYFGRHRVNQSTTEQEAVPFRILAQGTGSGYSTEDCLLLQAENVVEDYTVTVGSGTGAASTEMDDLLNHMNSTAENGFFSVLCTPEERAAIAEASAASSTAEVLVERNQLSSEEFNSTSLEGFTEEAGYVYSKTSDSTEEKYTYAVDINNSETGTWTYTKYCGDSYQNFSLASSKIFPLSVSDLTNSSFGYQNLMADQGRGIGNKPFWVRSTPTTEEAQDPQLQDPVQNQYASLTLVEGGGMFAVENSSYPLEHIAGIRPALCLKQNQIAFTYENARPAVFQATSEPSKFSSPWCISLKSGENAPFTAVVKGVNEAVVGSAGKQDAYSLTDYSVSEGDQLNVTITKTTTSVDYTQLSAMLVDETNHTVLAYGKIADWSDLAPTATDYLGNDAQPAYDSSGNGSRTIPVVIPSGIYDASHTSCSLFLFAETASEVAHGVTLSSEQLQVFEEKTLKQPITPQSFVTSQDVAFHYTGTAMTSDLPEESAPIINVAVTGADTSNLPGNKRLDKEQFVIKNWVSGEGENAVYVENPYYSVKSVGSYTQDVQTIYVPLTLQEQFTPASSGNPVPVKRAEDTVYLFYQDQLLGPISVSRSYTPAAVWSNESLEYTGNCLEIGQPVSFQLADGEVQDSSNNKLTSTVSYYKLENSTTEATGQNVGGATEPKGAPKEIGTYVLKVETSEQKLDGITYNAVSAEKEVSITKRNLDLVVADQTTSLNAEIKTTKNQEGGIPLLTAAEDCLLSGHSISEYTLALNNGVSTATAGEKANAIGLQTGTVRIQDDQSHDVTDLYNVRTVTSGKLTVNGTPTVTGTNNTWILGSGATTYNVADMFTVVPESIKTQSVYKWRPQGDGVWQTFATGSTFSTNTPGIYDIQINTPETAVYSPQTCEVMLTVQKGAGAGTISVANSQVPYGDSIGLKPVSTTGQSVTYHYRQKTSEEIAQNTAYDPEGKQYDLNEQPTTPGHYTVKATFSETALFSEVNAYADFEITKRNLTVVAKDQSVSYGGTIQKDVGQIQAAEGTSLPYGEQFASVDLVSSGTTVLDASGTITPSNVKIKKTGSNAEVPLDYYNVTYRDGTLTVNPLSFENISVQDVSTVYNGLEHSIRVTVPENYVGATVTYSGTQDGSYTGTNPAYKDVGTYTVYYKVTKEGYTDYTGSAQVQITPRPVTVIPQAQEIAWNHALNTALIDVWDGQGNNQSTTQTGLVGENKVSSVVLTSSGDTLTAGSNGYTITPSDLRIQRSDSDTADVTANYNIAYVAAENALTVVHDTALKPTGITAAKSRTVYLVNDENWAVTDVTVTATYADGYVEVIPYSTENDSAWKLGGYQLSDIDRTTGGAKTLTVSCPGAGGQTVSAQIAIDVYSPVQITAQPQDIAVSAGQSATFSVTASGTEIGEHVLRYQWQKMAPGATDWENITGADGVSYTTGELHIGDNSTAYRCIVTNGAEPVVVHVESNAATVTVNRLQVQHKKATVSLSYDGSAVDLSTLTMTLQTVDSALAVGKCFGLDPNAGTVSYELLEEGTTGTGTLSGSILTVNTVGAFHIKAVTAAKGDYAAGEADTVLTVKEGSISYKASGCDVNYDGLEHGITVTVQNPADTVVTYSTDGTTFTGTAQTYKHAGTYTVHYRVNKTNYTQEEGTADVVIRTVPLQLVPRAQTVLTGTELDRTQYTVNGLVTGDRITALDFTTDPADLTQIYDGEGSIALSNAVVRNAQDEVATGNYSISYGDPAVLRIEHNEGLAPQSLSAQINTQEFLTTAPSDALQTALGTLVVTASYEDGFSKTVAAKTQEADTGYTTNAAELNMSTAGEKQLIITYTENNKTVTVRITLTVKEPASIVTALADREVTAGNTASLSVTASGSATLTYRWEQSKDDGKNWTVIEGVSQASYTTPVLTTADDGILYRCTVSNDWGSAQTQARLKVNAVPVTITATNASMDYTDGMDPVRVEQYFTIDPNAGARTYTVKLPNGQTQQLGEDAMLAIKAAGPYEITLNTAPAQDIYAAGTATAVLTVGVGTIPNTVKGYTGVYDGQAHGISIVMADTENGSQDTTAGSEGATDGNKGGDESSDSSNAPEELTGVTVSYRLDEKDDWETVNPQFTEAGTYTVYYKLEKTSYETVTGSAKVEITSRPLTLTAKPQTVAWGEAAAQGADWYTADGLAEGDEIGSLVLTAGLQEKDKDFVAGTRFLSADLDSENQQALIVIEDKTVTIVRTSENEGNAQNPQQTETLEDRTGNYTVTCVQGALTVKHNETLPPVKITAEKEKTLYSTAAGTKPADLLTDLTVTASYEDGVTEQITKGYLKGQVPENAVMPYYVAEVDPEGLTKEGTLSIGISFTKNGETCETKADISVMAPPAIKKIPDEVKVTVGSDAVILAETTGTGVEYQWYVNQTGTEDGWEILEGADAASYTVKQTALEQNGWQYRLELTNAVGTVVSDPVLLTVERIPVVNKAKKETVALRFSDMDGAELEVKDYFELGEGAGTPVYTWKDKASDRQAETVQDGKVKLPAPGSYEITLVTGVNGNYAESAPVSVTLEVGSGQMTWKAEGTEVIYDGKTHGISLEAPEDAVITWYWEKTAETGTETGSGTETGKGTEPGDGMATGKGTETGNGTETGDGTDSGQAAERTYVSDKPLFTEAGIYTVYYRIAKSGYDTAEGSAQVQIRKRELKLAPKAQQIVSGQQLAADYSIETGALAEGDRIGVLTFRAESGEGDGISFTEQSEPMKQIGEGSISIDSDGAIVIRNAADKDVTGSYSVSFGGPAAYKVAHNTDLKPSRMTAEKKQTLYLTTDKLALNDLTVTVAYEDGYTQAIPAKTQETVTGYTTNAEELDLSVTGTKTLVISYTENEGTVEAEVQLTVESVPVITKQPENVKLKVGEEAVYSVSAEGTEPLSYQWYEKAGDEWKALTEETDSRLRLEKVKLEQSGVSYKCIVTNPHGTAESAEAGLAVERIPVQNKGADRTVSYSEVKDAPFDVSTLFELDEHAGDAQYVYRKTASETMVPEADQAAVSKAEALENEQGKVSDSVTAQNGQNNVPEAAVQAGNQMEAPESAAPENDRTTDESNVVLEDGKLQIQGPGIYTFGVTTAGNGDYAAGAEVTAVLTVTAAEIICKAETVKVVYDGTAYGPKLNVTEPQDAVITWYPDPVAEPAETVSADGTTDTAWTTQTPEVTDAGSYTFRYRVERYGYETVEGTAQVVIEKRKLTLAASPQKLFVGDRPNPNAYQVTEGSLAEGDLLKGVTLTADPDVFDKPGSGRLSLSDARIVSGEAERGQNYEITYAEADYTVEEAPTTEAPTTEELTTEVPTTEKRTEAPTTEKRTEAPTTEKRTEAPTTEKPTEAPVTEEPTEAPVTEEPTEAPTEEPITEAPTEEPMTEVPTEEPVTEAPIWEPVTEAPLQTVPSVGEKVTDAVATYIVTSSDASTPEVAYIANENTNQKTVVIPDTVVVDGKEYKVTSVADNAFAGNKNIKEVKVGKNIETIGEKAFAGCTELKKVTMSSGVKEIGDGAFQNCKKLTAVTIGSNVTAVGDNAFAGCTKLKTVKAGSKVTSVGNKAFAKCTALTKLTLSAKTTKIGSNAFTGCTKLKTLQIKSKKLTAKNLKKNAFKGLSRKTVIKVPKGKVTAYRKLFRKKGLSKKVKVKS